MGRLARQDLITTGYVFPHLASNSSNGEFHAVGFGKGSPVVEAERFQIKIPCSADENSAIHALTPKDKKQKTGASGRRHFLINHRNRRT